MDKLRDYFRESYDELMNKVTWPALAELQSTSIVVLISSLIIALIIALMDNISIFLLQNTIYSL